MTVEQSILPDRPSGTRKYYVYALCYPSGEPFYIGCGSGNRLYEHEHRARAGADRLLHYHIIRYIWEGGYQVRRRIYFETDDREAGLAREFELIRKLRRFGLITNCGTAESDRKRLERAEAPQRFPDVSSTRERRRPSLEMQVLIESCVDRLRAAAVEADKRAAERLPVGMAILAE